LEHEWSPELVWTLEKRTPFFHSFELVSFKEFVFALSSGQQFASYLTTLNFELFLFGISFHFKHLNKLL
jgi:hypothetical protein